MEQNRVKNSGSSWMNEEASLPALCAAYHPTFGGGRSYQCISQTPPDEAKTEPRSWSLMFNDFAARKIVTRAKQPALRAPKVRPADTFLVSTASVADWDAPGPKLCANFGRSTSTIVTGSQPARTK